MKNLRLNTLLGFCVLVIALLGLFVWLPLDIETGLVEKVRNRYVIGDTFGPVVALFLIISSSITLIVVEQNSKTVFINKLILKALLAYIMIFFVSLLIMRFLGPIFISIINILVLEDLNYRDLRDMQPVKYIGFVIGGTSMMILLSYFMDGALSRKRIKIFIAVAIIMALFFDIPFEDVLLPPNGDV
jgi:hypothetical protein